MKKNRHENCGVEKKLNFFIGSRRPGLNSYKKSKTAKTWAMLLITGIVSASAPAQDALNDGLTFYAPLDGSIDATVASGIKEPKVNKNTGFVEGRFGQGVELKDGKAQLYYSGDKNFNISEGTVAFWVKRYEKWGGSQKTCVLFKAVANLWNKSSLGLLTTQWDQLRAWSFADDGKESLIMSPNGIPYAAGEWYHMALTFKDGSVKIYVNGVEISYGQEVCDPMMVMPTGTVKFIQFGSDYDGSKLNGVLDELRIYNRALPAAGVKKLYEFVPVKQ